MRLASRLLLPLLLASALVGAADARTDEERAAERYARDNTVFTLYHEFGHMVVDQFDLPILAREEDAVDNLATLLALEDYERSPESSVLGNAVYGWELIVAEGDGKYPDTGILAGPHSLDGQRALTMVCLLVGKDREEFGQAATEWNLDDDRQEGCADDYAQAEAGWERVLAEHRVETAGEGARIEVVYEDAFGDNRAARRILEEGEVLERFAARMEEAFAIPEGITLKALECDEENAYYSSSDATIELCYELVRYYWRQYMEAPGGGGVASAAESERALPPGIREAEARAADLALIVAAGGTAPGSGSAGTPLSIGPRAEGGPSLRPRSEKRAVVRTPADARLGSRPALTRAAGAARRCDSAGNAPDGARAAPPRSRRLRESASCPEPSSSSATGRATGTSRTSSPAGATRT